MGKFEAYGDQDRDFDVRVGLAEGTCDCETFADGLWGAVADILELSFDGCPGEPRGAGAFSYWFENNDLSVSMFVEHGDEGWPWEKVPATLTTRSRSDTVETWELVEKLYDRLDASGTYALIVFDSGGMPITANFDIGDDW